MAKQPKLSVTVLLSLALALALTGPLLAQDNANWPRWRGPQDNGSVSSGTFPVEWDADRVLWKAPLPGKGCSTPIVWQQRIYVTAPVAGRDGLLAFDWSGELLWKTVFGDEFPGRHRNGSGSNPSPATDGSGVFVYFKSGTLAAVELDGKVRWQTNLVERYGADTLFWDHGTSPVLTANSVVMARMHHGESWLAAFDKVTGDLQWKVARNYETPVEGDQGYSTPLLFNRQGREMLLVWGGQHLTAHDVADGKVVWSCGGFNPDSKKLWPVIASPVIAGDVAVISHGRNDRGDPRFYGIRLGGLGDVTATHRLWESRDTGTFVPTPVEYDGRIYVVGDRGRVDCVDPATGKVVWSNSLPKNRAAFYASPLIAGGNLYAVREDGVVFVVKVEGGFELLAKNDMDELIVASPVPASNRLFLRGESHLFCIAAD